MIVCATATFDTKALVDAQGGESYLADISGSEMPVDRSSDSTAAVTLCKTVSWICKRVQWACIPEQEARV